MKEKEKKILNKMRELFPHKIDKLESLVIIGHLIREEFPNAEKEGLMYDVALTMKLREIHNATHIFFNKNLQKTHQKIINQKEKNNGR